MYKNNIYTRPGLIGFGAYQGLGVVRTPFTATRVTQKVGTTLAPPAPTGLDALPTWAYIAIPVGVVAVAAVVYYKWF
jgi:hypothetical protein